MLNLLIHLNEIEYLIMEDNIMLITSNRIPLRRRFYRYYQWFSTLFGLYLQPKTYKSITNYRLSFRTVLNLCNAPFKGKSLEKFPLYLLNDLDQILYSTFFIPAKGCPKAAPFKGGCIKKIFRNIFYCSRISCI